MCDVIRARTPTVGLSVKSPSYRGNPLALSLDTQKFERSQNKKIQRHDTLSSVCYHKRFANAKKYRNVDEYVTNKLGTWVSILQYLLILSTEANEVMEGGAPSFDT